MNRAPRTPFATCQSTFQAVVTPDIFAAAQKARQALSIAPTESRSQSQTSRALSRPSIPSRSHSQAPSQLTEEWETVDGYEDSTSSTASSSSPESDSNSDSDSDHHRQRKGKGKKRKRKDKDKKKKKKQKRGKRLSVKDKKVVLRICCKDFEIYAHSKPKAKFWEHVREQVKAETDKDHASLDKAVRRWEKDRRKVLKAIEDGLFSDEEEDDRELLIALDEWIGLLDGLKEKQKDQEDRIGKAGNETVQSRRLQENLGKRWVQKERSSAIEADDLSSELANPQESLNSFVETPVLSSQSPASSSQTSCVQAPAKRARQQPLPHQLLAEIAAGISSIAAELKADREGTAQSARREEWLRLNAELKELYESIETRLAASNQKTSLMLNILLRMEQQQSKEKGIDT